MKKLLVALVAAVLAGTGLVAAGAAPASADPYPGTVPTACDSGGPHHLKRGSKVFTRIAVRTGGNGRARGVVDLGYTRKKGGFSASRSVAYDGKRVRVRGPRVVKRGFYRVAVSFTPARGSVFRPCTDWYTVRVRKQKR